MKNVSSGFESRFHSDVVQCKRVKKTCYLHIYIRVYRKCLYKWGRWPANTLGTPHPRDATGQTGCIPLTLSPRCQAPTTQVENQAHMRTDGSCRAAPARSSSCPSSHGCQLRPTTQMRGRGEGRMGELPTIACRNTETKWERKDTCTRTDCTRTGMR